MLKIRNLFTENEYEAIRYEKYTSEQVEKCRKFITEKLDLCVRVIMPDLHICNLEHHNYKSVVKPSNYIIRRVSVRRMLRVISVDIFKSNFEVIELAEMSEEKKYDKSIDFSFDTTLEIVNLFDEPKGRVAIGYYGGGATITRCINPEDNIEESLCYN